MAKQKFIFIPKPFRWKNFFWRIFLILLGSFLGAVGINMFLVPFKLLTAGVAGIALLISYVWPVLSVGVLMVLINVPIFIAGWLYVDRKFTLWSLVGMLSLSTAVDLTRSWAAYKPVNDLYMSLIVGGLLSGIGVGLAFRARGSMGGTDIIAAILRKYYSMSIGTTQLALNGFIVLALGWKFGWTLALASAFSIYCESWSIDRTILGLNTTQALMVISDRPREVGEALMEKLNRGVTYLAATGGYSEAPKQVVYCVIPTRQLSYAKAIVEDVDPRSFSTVMDTVEVIGKGFRRLPI